MFDIINLNPEFQSQLGWIFIEAVLHTDYQTEPEFHAFLRKLNEDWLIKSRSDSALASETCLIQAINDVLKNHINTEDIAERCQQELMSKWIFHPKIPLSSKG